MEERGGGLPLDCWNCCSFFLPIASSSSLLGCNDIAGFTAAAVRREAAQLHSAGGARHRLHGATAAPGRYAWLRSQMHCRCGTRGGAMAAAVEDDDSGHDQSHCQNARGEEEEEESQCSGLCAQRWCRSGRRPRQLCPRTSALLSSRRSVQLRLWAEKAPREAKAAASAPAAASHALALITRTHAHTHSLAATHITARAPSPSLSVAHTLPPSPSRTRLPHLPPFHRIGSHTLRTSTHLRTTYPFQAAPRLTPLLSGYLSVAADVFPLSSSLLLRLFSVPLLPLLLPNHLLLPSSHQHLESSVR